MESGGHAQVVTETLNPFVVASAAVAALGGFLFGFDTGIISGALLFIKQEFGLSAGLQQLVVGSLLLAAVVGALLGGPISDVWGRKRTLILAALIFGVGALVASFSPNLAVLVVARVLLGLAIGIASMIVPVYIAEIAPPRVRGALVSLQQFMITVGIMVSYLVSYAFSGSGAWRWMLGVGMIPAAILFVGMLPLPESPRWLLAKDRRQDALGVLRRIRHEEHNPEAELAEIEAVHKMQVGVSYQDLFRPSVRPALVVGVGIAFINQMVGVNAVIFCGHLGNHGCRDLEYAGNALCLAPDRPGGQEAAAPGRHQRSPIGPDRTGGGVPVARGSLGCRRPSGRGAAGLHRLFRRQSRDCHLAAQLRGVPSRGEGEGGSGRGFHPLGARLRHRLDGADADRHHHAHRHVLVLRALCHLGDRLRVEEGARD